MSRLDEISQAITDATTRLHSLEGEIEREIEVRRKEIRELEEQLRQLRMSAANLAGGPGTR